MWILGALARFINLGMIARGGVSWDIQSSDISGPSQVEVSPTKLGIEGCAAALGQVPSLPPVPPAAGPHPLPPETDPGEHLSQKHSSTCHVLEDSWLEHQQVCCQKLSE